MINIRASVAYRYSGVGVTAPVLSDSQEQYSGVGSESRGGVKTYFHSALKNTDVQTNSAQTQTASRVYDAFGNVVSSAGMWKSPFAYAGKFGYQQDSDTGLKLLGHRYYDSSTGRFLTRDPIKDGRNWYSYCENNPIDGTDPNGLQEMTSANTRNKLLYLYDEIFQMGKELTDDFINLLVKHLRSKGLKISDHALGRLLERIDDILVFFDIINSGIVYYNEVTGTMYVWSEKHRQAIVVDRDGNIVTILPRHSMKEEADAWKAKNLKGKYKKSKKSISGFLQDLMDWNHFNNKG